MSESVVSAVIGLVFASPVDDLLLGGLLDQFLPTWVVTIIVGTIAVVSVANSVRAYLSDADE